MVSQDVEGLYPDGGDRVNTEVVSDDATKMKKVTELADDFETTEQSDSKQKDSPGK